MIMPRMREAKWANPIHLYIEADNEDNCHLCVIYVIRRSGRNEEVSTFMPGMQNTLEIEQKRNMAVLTFQFKIKHSFK